MPGLIDLGAYEPNAHVIFLVVATLTPDSYRSRFAARERGESHRPQHRYAAHLDPILRIQEHFLELADRYNIPIVDNDNFDRSVLSIVRHVTESLRKKVPFDVAELL